ncbi:MAG: 4-hydroxy-tetrahydrodipicolinate reductase [Magnetovibrio sp.]|nr:4-hydroxy-tetrahydrodipicolinate reductase [Magnetovibrio sp.]
MKIGVVGCAGRMGRMLVATVLETEGAELAGGTEAPGSPFAGADVAQLAGAEPAGIAVGDDAAALFEAADAVIDFTIPAATVAHAALAKASGTALVVGTTGLGEAEMAELAAAAEGAAIVHAGNMSLGINLLVGLTEQVAGALGPDYDIEVVEMHHRHKIDAPSGTALMLGRAAAAGRGIDHGDNAVMSREGETGARPRGAIGYAALRGGDVIGDHSVIFAGPGERIEIVHKAGDRSLFARGALTATLWTEGRAPGLYTMRDVLGMS